MWVKICGLTRLDDARACRDAGVDAVGLNLYAGPRRLDHRQVALILDSLPSSVTPVALVECLSHVVDATTLAFLGDHGVHYLQLYGEVSPALLTDLAERAFRVIVPCRVAGAGFAAGLKDLLPGGGAGAAWAVLLDTEREGQAGGTGRTFPWDWIVRARERGSLAGWPNLILAGGLAAHNVAEAIRTARPFGVDVCSGVESAPGIKDHAKVRAFVEAARHAAGPPSPAGGGIQPASDPHTE